MHDLETLKYLNSQEYQRYNDRRALKKALYTVALLLILLGLSYFLCGCGKINKEILDASVPKQEAVEWGPWTETDLNRVVDYYSNPDDFFMWVFMNIGYTGDPDGALNTALKVLNARKGSCVGHALLYRYYFERKGVECVMIDIYGDGGNYAHCGLIVPSTMKWYSVEKLNIELPYCDIEKAVVLIGDKLGHTIQGYGYYDDKEYIKL